MMGLALNPTTFAYGLGLALILGLGIGASSIWYVKGLQITAIKATHKAEAAEMAKKVAVAEGGVSKLKLDFETSLEGKRNELDQTYASRVAAVNSTVGKLAGIRLRDPAASGNSSATSGQGNAQSNNGSSADGTGLLSPQTSQFLWSFAGESQIYLDRLVQCKAWNTELEAQQKKYFDELEEVRKKVK
jgi:hypothetical protein